MLGMGMSLSCSQTCRQEQRLDLYQRLTLEQRVLLGGYLHDLGVELTGAIREERYQPVAQCFQCSHKMEPVDILHGFRDVVDDFTTECPKCHHRFEPKLICFAGAGSIELPYFCSVQVLGRLRTVADKPPEVITRELPGEYRSAVIHHGTLRNAFQKLSIRYDFPEVTAWESKAQPFLGRLPDTVIARCTGVSVSIIRARRHKAGIRRFCRSQAVKLAEAEVSLN